MPSGLYRRFVDDGVLLIDEGLRMSRPETLVNHLLHLGIKPEAVYCDRFIVGALLDAIGGRWPVLPRVARWKRRRRRILPVCVSSWLVMGRKSAHGPECRWRWRRLGLSKSTLRRDDQRQSVRPRP